jgi:hypothetical protein
LTPESASTPSFSSGTSPPSPQTTVKLAYSTYRLFEPEHLSRSRPIILDESCASPETAALHEEGYEGALVARAESPRDHLSMSTYGKSQPPQIQGKKREARSLFQSADFLQATNEHTQTIHTHSQHLFTDPRHQYHQQLRHRPTKMLLWQCHMLRINRVQVTMTSLDLI